MRAERAGKPANAWCREKVIEAATRPRVTVAEFAILAEVVAVEDILIELLWAIVKHGGEPPIEKFRQITAKAHAAKQKEAWKLLCDTQAPAEALLLEPARYSAPTAR